MAEQIRGKVNLLERLLPEGLLVDAAWLGAHGYSTSLRRQYVTAGWLDRPARQVYRRKRGSLSWQQAVVSLQTLLDRNLVVGGRTALELQGFAHYLPQETKTVHLYGTERPPNWLGKLPIDATFAYHNIGRLFSQPSGKPPCDVNGPANASSLALPADLVSQPWGQWKWALILSSPERALLELLDELPDRESFHQVDKLVEGLSPLSPRRLEKLLLDCRSVKAKRLFFFFADRHKHAWLRHIDRKAIDLGKGKRMLVRGGKLSAPHQITVPEDLDGVQ
ncbi:type IV toxin-antitoxin system AbiEi family antitoxin domain-containing protein [uncultured Paludibaculum sp.]|uniref:type IV toxin-antitoxin system AbiEi family antitoxin domain-containing protein n=1 Tax=uncultured Paludibaculum sp. TaxID=1765020 RepID=UPI002AAAD3BF|nr:type IV toxin-antitoxin system AbiEi family antitoxin domain-containing protein [uncultured Paludibaculum sp.]